MGSGNSVEGVAGGVAEKEIIVLSDDDSVCHCFDIVRDL